jgi:hypothetical protein
MQALTVSLLPGRLVTVDPGDGTTGFE